MHDDEGVQFIPEHFVGLTLALQRHGERMPMYYFYSVEIADDLVTISVAFPAWPKDVPGRSNAQAVLPVELVADPLSPESKETLDSILRELSDSAARDSVRRDGYKDIAAYNEGPKHRPN